MPNEEPLYNDGKLKIDYLPKGVNDHILFIKDRSYALPRGALEEFAKTSTEEIWIRIHHFNDSILYDARQENIGVGEIHEAIQKAYQEEERRIRETPLPHLGEQ